MNRDLWDEMVGVPVELWHAATTTDALRDLLARREAGDFLPRPPHSCANCDGIYDFFGTLIKTARSTGCVAV
jgi:hypothetical protein